MYHWTELTFSAFTFMISNGPLEMYARTIRKITKDYSDRRINHARSLPVFNSAVKHQRPSFSLLVKRDWRTPSVFGSVLHLWLIFPDIFSNHDLNCKE